MGIGSQEIHISNKEFFFLLIHGIKSLTGFSSLIGGRETGKREARYICFIYRTQDLSKMFNFIEHKNEAQRKSKANPHRICCCYYLCLFNACLLGLLFIIVLWREMGLLD